MVDQQIPGNDNDNTAFRHSPSQFIKSLFIYDLMVTAASQVVLST